MSGFEIVGVVLGVLPLLVEGLKTYQHGLETASHMIKYEKAIRELVIRFTLASSLYIHTCERLLRPLMLDKDKWLELVDNPGGALWKDEELGRQIRDRLGSDEIMFIDISQRLHARLIKFAVKLDLDTNPTNKLQPKWLAAEPSSQSSLRQKFFHKSNQTWKGLKIGFSNGGLESALQKIETDLGSLDRLLDVNEREAPVRCERKRRGAAKKWKSIREAAKNVYDVLAAHWQCPSDHRHAASLRLESREQHEQDAAVRFGIILSLNHIQPQTQQPLWHELEIEPEPQAVAHKSQASVSPVPGTKSGFKVSFMATPTITVTSTQAQGKPPVDPADKIQSLCRWQRNHLAPTQDSLGVLEHQLWSHRLFRGKTCRTQANELSLFSLRDCVVGSSPPSAATAIFARGLSTKEKYHIAIVLASSVLQLANTPWLPQSEFDLQRVCLVDLKQRALTAANPYIRKDFSSTNILPCKQTTPLIENELVFALGVILIELAYQQPLSDFKLPGDVDAQGNDYPHTDLQIATRLVKELPSMEGEKYADAARRCVKCSFDVHDYSLDNVDFQDQFYTGVVLPLQELKAELK